MAALPSTKLDRRRLEPAQRGAAHARASMAGEAGKAGEAKVALIDGPDRPIAVEVSAIPASSESPPRLPSLERVQWAYIQAVLESCDGNVSEAARRLGIHRQSLQRMLRRHPPNR